MVLVNNHEPFSTARLDDESFGRRNSPVVSEGR